MTNLATDVGADAPAPYALERSAPADTPAYLSTHDAAAVLRKLRQPKTNDTDTSDPRHSASLRAFTPVFDGLRTRVNALEEAGTGSARATAAAPEAGKESTAADAADDAAPADPRVKPGDQDPGERTEGADRQQEPASIEPPRSWTKEDKELFTSL